MAAFQFPYVVFLMIATILQDNLLICLRIYDLSFVFMVPLTRACSIQVHSVAATKKHHLEKPLGICLYW